jgi:polyketide synthase 13
MAVVDLADDELYALARDFPGVHVAVHSSPGQKVVTGEEEPVVRLVRRLEAEGRPARAMRVAGAGHSPQVEPLLAELTAELADIRGGLPRLPVYSTVLDDPRGDCVFDAAHWAANLRRPVRLDRAVAAAAADGHTAFVEVSPHPVLTRAITDTAPEALALGTLHRDADTAAGFLTQVGTLHTAGLRLPLPPGRVIDLPGPRWRHARHWWTDARAGVGASASSTAWGDRGGASGRDRLAAEARVVPVRHRPEADRRTAGGHVAEGGAGPEDSGRPEAWQTADHASVSARLCHHIAAVTGHPPARITPATAFAELGLDSLMAVRVRAALEGEFGIELPLRDLLGAATVEATAARVQRALQGEAAPTAGDGQRVAPAEARSAEGLRAGPTQPAPAGDRPRTPPAQGHEGASASRVPGAATLAALPRTSRAIDEETSPHPPRANGGHAPARAAGVLGEAPAPDASLAIREKTRTRTDETERADSPPHRLDASGALPRPRPGGRSGPHPLLHPLHTSGPHPPLFLVHAAGGTTDVYRSLVERLDGERPVYGLERVGEARTVVEKARRYAEAVAAAHPEGPCLLGGWSFGGFVAQEVARQLTDAGRDVPLVVLLDSVRPLPRPEGTAAERIRAHFTGFARHVADAYGVELDLSYDELVAIEDDGERVDTVLRALREAADVPRAALDHQRASYLDLRIGEAHRPGRHDGRVVLYRATEPAPHTVRDPAYERDDEALGWDEVCPRLTVVRVTGHHLSLLDPPNVDEIAAHLRWQLAGETR